jgi:tellurite resistance protein
MDGLITAAAEMALADGRVDPVEQRSLLAFLRQDDMLAALGRRAIMERFTAALNDVAARQAAGSYDGPDLAGALRPVAGPYAARLIARAAAHVAAADGVLHPRERQLLRALHRALGLTHMEQPA